ncbi:NDR1/HIN1-like protein 13, partial [Cucurbita argyrosperma subsp. argyrosperma]
MAERVHPTDSDAASAHSGDAIPPKNPPPGTYVIQLPKDQVYRVPPPENATRFDLYSRRNTRPSLCRRFLCSILLLITVLLLLFAIVSGLFFLILQPLSPRYSILAISTKGMQIKPNASISPQFNVTVRAENPNKKIGIYYERNSNISVNFGDVMLCKGALPALYQPWRNVTVMAAKLKGSGIKLSSSAVKALKDSEKQGKVKLKVDLRAPIKMKLYWMKTWTIRAKVSCEIWVKKVTGEAKATEKKCEHSLKLW